MKYYPSRSALALLLACAPALTAQQVRGRLVTAADSTPVDHALLLLLDQGGQERARSATSPSGGFDLRAPSPGRYRLRVQRIGQQGWEAPPMDMAEGTSLNLTLYVPDAPFELPPLEVVRRRPRCGV